MSTLKLFTRSKTLNVLPKSGDGDSDEFGRFPSRSSAFSTSKKDKSLKQLDKALRQRTVSNPNFVATITSDRPGTPRDFGETQDGFLATNLDPPPQATDEFGLPKPPDATPPQDYGYIHWEKHIILGIDEVTRLVDVVAEELRHRGLTTPLLFSPMALDINSNTTRKLVKAFLATVPHDKCLSITEQQWRDEAKFSGPHELAMLIRWALARIVRVERNIELRGFLSFEHYVLWKRSEEASGFPNDYYAQFIQPLDMGVRGLLASLFDLLSRFAANATSSGLTPIAIASLFGPLLFGLGSPALAFSHAYTAYLRASHATEHLLLSFIRWQETQAQIKGVIPARLKDWVRGYPSMIPALERMEKPRRGARLVRMGSVKRNVRLYSPDLLRTSASWSTVRGEFANSKDWSRICPATLKLPPRFAESFRKFLDVTNTFYPELGPASNGFTPVQEGSTSSLELGSIGGPLKDENRFRNLTDLKWGEFESIGFTATDSKKLAFDLTESARKSRTEKRQTLSWNDFSEAGFSRMDAPLSATLQFATPLASTISSWPEQSVELHRKLKKAQKALPPFGWDTTPVLGQEEVVEEGFLEVFTQLVYGSGWMERTETTFRDCNWALVEFKSLPQQRPPSPPSGDPRTASTLLLFEEFVPREYRDQLTAPKKKRLFASLGSTNKKQWKPAQTLNGRPYVIGNTPVTPSTAREVDFENMLRNSESTTKLLSLSRGISTRDHPIPTPFVASQPLPSDDIPPVPPLPPIPPVPPLPGTLKTARSKFKRPSRRNSGIPAEAETIDFETRTASNSEGSDNEQPLNSTSPKSTRRHSKDDAWIDIMINDNSKRRMAGQDAAARPRSKSNISDPDMAKRELAEVLGGAGLPPPEEDIFDSQVGKGASHLPNGRPLSQDSMGPEPYPYSMHPMAGRPSIDSQDDYKSGDGPVIRVQSPSVAGSVAPSPHVSRYMGPAGGYGHGREDSGDFVPVDMREQEIEIPGNAEWPASEPQSATLPHSPSPAVRPLPAPPAPASPQPSEKRGTVSSLIEMYQTKTDDDVPKVPPPRGDSLKGGASPIPPAEPIPPTPPLESANGRASPARYIHGAPLHNVIEEEEED